MANPRPSARRRAAHHRPSRRQPNNGTLSKFLVMLAVVAAVILGITIFFRVRDVEVQGNSIYSAAQISQASGVEAGDNLLLVNRAAVAGKIEAVLPFVQDVSVGLILPDTIVVKVVESQLACRVTAESGGVWYINPQGRVLGSSVDGFAGQLVDLQGFTLASPEAGKQAEASEGMETALEAALTVVREMDGTGLMEQVTIVDTEKPYDIELFCAEQYQILLGGTDELDYKIQYLQVVLDGLDPYQTGTIDLTFDQERVAVFSQWE